jgi:hypothetical protein
VQNPFAVGLGVSNYIAENKKCMTRNVLLEFSSLYCDVGFWLVS